MAVPVRAVSWKPALKGELMAKVIGIDLGTTNSCVAVMEGADARVIETLRVRGLPPPW